MPGAATRENAPFMLPAKKRGQAGLPTASVSSELLEIALSVSKGGAGLSLERHLQIIESRRAQEVECFLRACALRLKLKGAV